MNVIDRRSPLPLYSQLKNILLEKLEEGEFPTGASFPTEMSLVEQYGLSRATVRQAIKDLEHEGYISRIQGKGTIVLREKSPLKRGLSQLTSFSEDMTAHGYETSTQILDYKIIPPSHHAAALLKTSQSDPLIHINRLRVINKIPAAINFSIVRLPEGVQMTRADLEHTISLYSLFELKKIPLVDAEKTIEAISAIEEHARLLNVAIGSPLLKVEGVIFTINHTPLEYHVVISRSDLYKYSLHLLR